MEKPDIEGLRKAARVYYKLSDWLSNEPKPRARDRQLWRAARVISGLGRELWAVRVWAAREAALFTARQISDSNHDHIAAAICWLAAHGTGGGFTDPGAGTTRCVPKAYLDATYAFACAAIDAAGAPHLPFPPLYRRKAHGGKVWDAAFMEAYLEEASGVLDAGLDTLAGLTRDDTSAYRECALRGQHILLARKMHSIASLAMEEETGQSQPSNWSVEDYAPGLWHATPAASGAYPTLEEAETEASRRSDAALRNMSTARAAARAALGLPPEPAS